MALGELRSGGERFGAHVVLKNVARSGETGEITVLESGLRVSLCSYSGVGRRVIVGGALMVGNGFDGSVVVSMCCCGGAASLFPYPPLLLSLSLLFSLDAS